MAVLGVLAGITFGIFQGVKDSQNRTRAKAELSVLSQALERFKSKYGDYPWTAVGSDPSNLDSADNMTVAKENSAILLNALMGWGRFDLKGSAPDFDPNMEGVPLIDVSKLTVRKIGSDLDFVDFPANPSQAPSGYYLSDPMGNPYVYLYGQDTNRSRWENFGYVLYSKGNDEVDSIEGFDRFSGLALAENDYRYHAKNADNIYVGE